MDNKPTSSEQVEPKRMFSISHFQNLPFYGTFSLLDSKCLIPIILLYISMEIMSESEAE